MINTFATEIIFVDSEIKEYNYYGDTRRNPR